MSAPYSPTLGEVHGIDQDFQGFQLTRARIWNVTSSLTVAYGEAPGDGAIAYNGVNGAKRLKFYDTEVTADVVVPRLDYVETVTAAWAFNRSGSNPPFTANQTLPSAGSTATMVTNLNANHLQGYSISLTQSNQTIPVYYTSGRLLVGTPVAANDAVTKAYADALGAGLNPAANGPVNAATTAAIADLSAASVTQDGVTLIAGDRLLVKDTASPDGIVAASHIYDGIYTVGTVSGGAAPLTRATDSDTTAEVDREYTFVSDGTINQGRSYLQLTNDPVLGTDALNWVLFYQVVAQNPGNGIDITGNLISVKVNASTTYTAGGILYHGSTSTISSVALTGIVKGNGASAPTAVLPGTTSGVTSGTLAKFSSSTPYLIDSLITESGSTITVTGALTVTGTTTLATTLTGILKGASGVVSAITFGTSGTLVKWGATTLSDSIVSESGSTLTIAGTPTITTGTGSLTITAAGAEILHGKPTRYSATATVTDCFSSGSGSKTAASRQTGFFNGGTQITAANSDVIAGFANYMTVNNGATHTGIIAAGFYGDDIAGDGSTIATVAHIYLNTITRSASTAIWAIYAAGNNSAFGGNTRFGGVTAPTVAVDVTGSVKVSTLSVSSPVFTNGSSVLTSTGTVGIANGGTGVATFTAGVIISPGTTTALSSVTGTAGTLVKWGTNTLADSIVSESGSTITIAGTPTLATSVGALTISPAGAELLFTKPIRFSVSATVTDTFSTGSGTRTAAGRQSGFINGGQQTSAANSDKLMGFANFMTPNNGAAHTGLLAAGFYSDDFGGTGTIATVAHIYLETLTRASSTAKWQIYSAGGNSCFGGSTRFGSVVAPTKTVDITGTLSASGATVLGGALTLSLFTTGLLITDISGVVSNNAIGTLNRLTKWSASGITDSLISDDGTTLTYNSIKVARKVIGTFGDGSSTSFVLTHNLSTDNVVVEIFLTSGTKQTWHFDVTRSSTNAVTVNTGFAPASNAFGYTIIG